MSIQPVSALVAAIVSFAIGGSVLLREPRRGAHGLFATFAFNIALYCSLAFIAKRFDSPFFNWLSLGAAVLLPATAQRFFRAFLGEEAGPPPLSKSTVFGAVVFYVLLLLRFVKPVYTAVWFHVALIGYVFAGLYLSVFYLYRRYRATPSRVEKKRLLYLLVGGFLTVTASLAEALPHGPNFGNVFIIVYLYFLSQNLVRYRLLDLNELLGRMVVLGTLVFILAFIYGVLVRWVGTDEPGLFFFNTLLASATIVILIEPLRTRVEGGISRWMFQEKFELSRRIEMLRAELANVIDMRVLVPRVLAALEDSRRITHAAIYLADPDGSGYEMSGYVGPKPEPRFDAITHRPFFERLRRIGVISQEGIEREVGARRPVSTEEQESLQLMLRTLEQMNGSVALGFSSEDQLLGALVIRDDRLREAYSTDEIELFRGVAHSIGITLQNSQVYERMKERDRLAALGQMAAGLAHEIRNPLGSIKGAAQFLQPPQDGTRESRPEGREGTREGTREFLDIIVEEVNRLNKIVSQFLDYARPYRGEQRPLEVADVLKKTLTLLPKEQLEEGSIEIATTFAERMPPVRADAEQLLQVFLNLSLNAIQAMPGGGAPGKLLISTALRRATRRGATVAFLEVRFRDTGVGIPPNDLKNLFIPFFTTKDKGTGLGLPISQRIIENHGGTIEVRSQPGEGATFTVLLPIEADAYAAYLDATRVEGPRRTPQVPAPPVPPPVPVPPPLRAPAVPVGELDPGLTPPPTRVSTPTPRRPLPRIDVVGTDGALKAKDTASSGRRSR
ncbi:MAG TPA: ATP-binding protein [Polyangia bacterium]|nr:ATP-binding protein [Polyangia bacterium]